jgi:flagellar basal body-associated protein FliL
MAPPLLFLVIVLVVAAVVAVVFFTGLGTKLTRDSQEGDLPSQKADERPEHVAVTRDDRPTRH